MSNRAFRIFLSILFLFGVAAGYRLSALAKLETHKLLNVAGLSYNFLGVLVLSELLATSSRWKDACVRFLAPGVLWFNSVIPLGAFLGSLVIARLMHKPSSGTVAQFSLTFFFNSLIPLSILNEFVVLPTLPFAKADIETRWRLFGFFLVLTGTGVQLIAGLLAIIG